MQEVGIKVFVPLLVTNMEPRHGSVVDVLLPFMHTNIFLSSVKCFRF